MRIPDDTGWHRPSDGKTVPAAEARAGSRTEPIDATTDRRSGHPGRFANEQAWGNDEAPAQASETWDASKGDRRQQQRRERDLPTMLDTRLQHDRRRPKGAYPAIQCKI